MIINISGKDYQLHFGIKFIRELDKVYTVEQDGVQFGAGMEIAYPKLINRSPVILAEVIRIATNTLPTRPTQTEIDTYLEQADDLEPIFNEVISELKNGKITAPTVAKLDKMLPQ